MKKKRMAIEIISIKTIELKPIQEIMILYKEEVLFYDI